MPYTIKLSNGLPLVDVPDGAVDTATTSLNLVGKNLSGYGPYQNANFVHLLENFASDNAPDSPIAGQVWYDTAHNQLKVRTIDSLWKTLGNIITSTTQPVVGTSVIGDVWYNTTSKQLFIFNGTVFELIGTSVPGFGKSRLEGQVILGTPAAGGSERSFPVLTLFLDDAVIGIIAKESFTPTTAIPGLHSNSAHPTQVIAGLNLVGSTLLNGKVDQAHKFIDPTDGPLGTTSFLRTDKNSSQTVVGPVTIDDTLTVTNSVVGDVTGNVTGNVTGDVTGDVTGNVTGNVTGDVTGDVTGNLTGNVTGDLNGNTFGDHTGTNTKVDFVKTKNGVKTVIDLTKSTPEFTGKFIGDLVGNVVADVTGNVSGNVTGDVTGNITGDLSGNTTGSHKGNVLASDNSIAYNATTKQFFGNVVGNTSTASALQLARQINGVSFDGTASITVYDNTKVPTTGGTITGTLTLTQQPIGNLHAANKLYVDDKISQSLSEYLLSRPLFFSLDTRGLNVSGTGTGSVVALLNSIAPPSSFTANTICNVASTIQNISTSASVTTGGWISITYVRSVSVTTTVSDPTRNNNLVYKVNSSKTSWEYVSG